MAPVLDYKLNGILFKGTKPRLFTPIPMKMFSSSIKTFLFSDEEDADLKSDRNEDFIFVYRIFQAMAIGIHLL